MTNKPQILHRYTGAVLFEGDAGMTTRQMLEKATAAKANLRGANLRGADLGGANLGGADLDGIKNALDGGTPYSWRVVAVRYSSHIMIAAGCRWMTVAEAREHWGHRADRTRMLPLLDYVEKAL